MIREILTLLVDETPLQYYISFEKDRKHFNFQPTLKNKTAPSFDIIVRENELIVNGEVEPAVAQQAREKVREILSNDIFDHFK